MPESKITTEVAGRICAISAAVGADVSAGDDIVFVEAMKMEIPVAATIAGKIKSILVSFDEMIVEGHAVAIIET